MRVPGAAGVVLTGGRSARMGTAKAGLEWHGSTLLYRTTALLQRAVDGPVVVVRAPGQRLPRLPSGVTALADPVEGLGPMQGIAVGLAAVAERAELAFVCSTDLPFLHPAFVTAVLRELAANRELDLVMPVTGGHRQPLAAAYRTSLDPLITTLLGRGEARPSMLLTHCVTALPDERALRAHPEVAGLDPELVSLVNVNTPRDYALARARPAPEILVEWTGPRLVAAASLGAAASAVGLELGVRVLATVNGGRVARDAQLPLVVGDHVTFSWPRTAGPPRPPEATTA